MAFKVPGRMQAGFRLTGFSETRALSCVAKTPHNTRNATQDRNRLGFGYTGAHNDMGGLGMAERPIPYSWEGRQVVVSILVTGGYSGEPSYTPLPLQAPERAGTLEQVTELGIVASLEDEEDEPDSTFYPWSAVLSMRLEE